MPRLLSLTTSTKHLSHGGDSPALGLPGGQRALPLADGRGSAEAGGQSGPASPREGGGGAGEGREEAEGVDHVLHWVYGKLLSWTVARPS